MKHRLIILLILFNFTAYTQHHDHKIFADVEIYCADDRIHTEEKERCFPLEVHLNRIRTWLNYKEYIKVYADDIKGKCSYVNGFATIDDNNERIIVLDKSITKLITSYYIPLNTLFVLAHEFGHHYDKQVEGINYHNEKKADKIAAEIISYYNYKSSFIFFSKKNFKRAVKSLYEQKFEKSRVKELVNHFKIAEKNYNKRRKKYYRFSDYLYRRLKEV